MASGTHGSDKISVNPDLQSKYTKLASEYAKLRSQLPVLKRAVLDEQTKNSELTESLQVRDQSLRKLEQEVDSLNFRNKQLEKRIGVLQNELGEITAKGNKSKKSSKDIQNLHDVGSSSSLDYELVSKIEENMRLQKQLSDLEQSSNLELEYLRSQLESLNNEETHKELILNELTSLKSDNQSLTFALQNSLDEIEAYREQVEQLREKISTSHHALNSQGTNSGSEVVLDNASTKIKDESSTSSEPVNLLEKLKHSEQQREYWTLEYQLLKMKYERILKKWEECKESLRSLGREDLLQLNSSEVTSPVMESSNFIGRMEVIYADSQDLEQSGRSFEKEVKECMSEKINELVGLLQYADSRAVHFYRECKSMESQLSIFGGKFHLLQEQLQKIKSNECELKEELHLTKQNYETQITQLSEHLALMNEKIAEKQEYINELQSKNKSKK